MFCSIALHLVPEGADHLTRLSSQKAHPTLLPPPPTAWDHRHKSFCGFLGSKLRHSPFPRQPSPFSPLPSLNSYHVNDRIPLLQGFSSFLFMFFSFFLLSLFTNSVSLNPHIFFCCWVISAVAILYCICQFIRCTLSFSALDWFFFFF